MKVNFQAIYMNVMITLLFILNFVTATPEQRVERFKVTMQALDSLNKAFAVEAVINDSIVSVDTIKADTFRNDSMVLDGPAKDGVVVKQ